MPFSGVPRSAFAGQSPASPSHAIPLHSPASHRPGLPRLRRAGLCAAQPHAASPSQCYAAVCHVLLLRGFAKPSSQCLALPCLCTAQGRIVKPCLSFALHSTAFQCVAVHAFAVHGKSSRHAATPLLSAASPGLTVPSPAFAVRRSAPHGNAFAVPCSASPCKEQRFIAFAGLRTAMPGPALPSPYTASQFIAFAELSGATRRDAFALRIYSMPCLAFATNHAAWLGFAFAMRNIAWPNSAEHSNAFAELCAGWKRLALLLLSDSSLSITWLRLSVLSFAQQCPAEQCLRFAQHFASLLCHALAEHRRATPSVTVQRRASPSLCSA